MKQQHRLVWRNKGEGVEFCREVGGRRESFAVRSGAPDFRTSSGSRSRLSISSLRELERFAALSKLDVVCWSHCSWRW